MNGAASLWSTYLSSKAPTTDNNYGNRLLACLKHAACRKGKNNLLFYFMWLSYISVGLFRWYFSTSLSYGRKNVDLLFYVQNKVLTTGYHSTLVIHDAGLGHFIPQYSIADSKGHRRPGLNPVVWLQSIEQHLPFNFSKPQIQVAWFTAYPDVSYFRGKVRQKCRSLPFVDEVSGASGLRGYQEGMRNSFARPAM